MIQSSGCQLLTVHGRTIKQKGQLTGMADWEAIKAVKYAAPRPMSLPYSPFSSSLYPLVCTSSPPPHTHTHRHRHPSVDVTVASVAVALLPHRPTWPLRELTPVRHRCLPHRDAMDIPVFANGNILYAEDVAECIRQTGVDGVMVAEGNLADPSLFSTESVKTAVLTEEYIALAKKHNATWGQVKAHLFRMWHQCLTHHTDLRDRLGASCHSIADAEVVAAELKKRLEEEEAQGTDADGDGVIHNALSGPRPRPPRWVSQPKVRDVAKDSKVVANDKAARMKSNAAAKAEGERAYQTANGNGGGEGPAAARKLSETEIEGEAGKDKPPPNKKAKTRRIEAIKNGSGRWQFCETCKGNPRGSKCLHQLCKACCKIRFASDGAVCPPHKIYAGPPAHIAALKAAGKDPKEYAGPPSHVLAAQAEAAATAPAAGGANPPA